MSCFRCQIRMDEYEPFPVLNTNKSPLATKRLKRSAYLYPGTVATAKRCNSILCDNGGTCFISLSGRPICSCPPGFEGIKYVYLVVFINYIQSPSIDVAQFKLI